MISTFDFNTIINGTDVPRKVRMLDIYGDRWFVASDVCKMLDIKQVDRAMGSLHEIDKEFCQIEALDRKEKLLIVSEFGVEALILRSQNPVARPLQEWLLRSKILPMIRDEGHFTLELGKQSPHAVDSTITLQQQADALRRLIDELDATSFV